MIFNIREQPNKVTSKSHFYEENLQKFATCELYKTHSPPTGLGIETF